MQTVTEYKKKALLHLQTTGTTCITTKVCTYMYTYMYILQLQVAEIPVLNVKFN